MNTPLKDQGDNTPKKTYAAPKLETYGNVSKLTQLKGGTANDGGGVGAPNTKV